MSRIDKKFEELKKKRKKALIVYITAGDPSLRYTQKLTFALGKAGVDIIELGVPFSDPLADGPTIQRASERSLKKGTNLGSILKLAKSIRMKLDIPLALMSYYNPIFRYGIEKFVKDSKNAGVDGVIVPDLPPEEAGPLVKLSKKYDFSCIFLIAPTSTPARIKLALAKSSGFIYYVSITGVTGARKKLPKELIRDVKAIKRISKQPICVGFGISDTKQVKEISKVADGIIVGSAVIKVIEKNLAKADMVKKVYRFASSLARALVR